MADMHYKHLNNLYSAGWFSRSWVVQEVVLSKHSMMVLGDSLLPLKKVLCVARSCYYYDRGLDDANLFIVRMLASILDKDNKVAHPKSADTVSSPAAAMYHLLFAMMYQELSDPRDRIYSILGLVPWPDGIPHLLVPDYGKSARNVHRDAARYQLQDPGLRLATLQQVYHYSAPAISEVDMPSWVPCWIRSRMDLRPSGSHLFNHATHGDTAIHVRYSSTEEPDVLEVSGISVDIITEVGEVFERTDFAEQSSVDKVLSLFHKVRRLLNPDLATNAGMFELANFLLQGWPSLKAWQLKDWAHWTSEETVENISVYITYLVMQKLQPPMLEALAIGEDEAVRKASRFLKQLVWVWADNQLFQTASGRIGIGRGIMSQGYELVVLYGGQVPFVLRPSGVYHQYVCDAYCHGIMNGEAISQQKAEGTASQVFRLR
ncbi:hypothetical protein LTR27_001808 [Elasticomyces elasticus]|nr:hypothetical protein LTR27_001808 [Elasticomyces elasticus]